jgi:nucleoside-diphosphate-sugar epimerase
LRVIVTGATGFIGKHVIGELLKRGHDVVAVSRKPNLAENLSWSSRVSWVECDTHRSLEPLAKVINSHCSLIHLAWPGLPNYRDFFHVESNFAADLKFMRWALDLGVNHLLVAGTCLEYGIVYGPIPSNHPCNPVVPYGLAKDMLLRSLVLLQKKHEFNLDWFRIFYVYGEGQSAQSLLSQLDRAIKTGAANFPMSKGDQIRDFVPVHEVASDFVNALENPRGIRISNACSGEPRSVLDFVLEHLKKSSCNLALERGQHPYPDYESLAFWGVRTSI